FDKDDIPTSPILSDDEDERPDFSQARLDVVEVK
ncbi:TPA: tRNA 2-thiocytidine(32) synthetase TtcA, partial [Proteus mirabilis]|nr:tRNA 2-thiocytidine(32) synthetase TtcA [Proteus mirabilis]